MKMIVSTFLFSEFVVFSLLFSFAESETSELDCLSLIFIADVFGQLFFFFLLVGIAEFCYDQWF